MSECAKLLFANEAFYHAFRNRDVEAMDAVWAKSSAVACIHPGWSALSCRDDVIASWRGILSNPQSPQIACRQPTARVIGEVGLVVCYEKFGEHMGGTVLVATNLFAREGGNWKLIHHQAGPCDPAPPAFTDEPPNESLQ